MRRTLPWVGVAMVAMLFADSATIRSSASTGPTIGQPRSWTLLGHVTDSYVLDVDPPGPSPGDELFISEDLTLPNGTPAGHDSIQCTDNVPTDSSVVTEICIEGWHTLEGQLAGQTPVTTTLPVGAMIGGARTDPLTLLPRAFKMPVIGGTERFKNAKGQVHITPTDAETTYEFTLTP